jgi:hypothetical protein
MRFKSATEFKSLPAKAVTIMGMSGVGKTTLAVMLQKSGWFQYSVDYRIGTRYMDEPIVDNFKREAMKVPFLAELLKSDSIYIRSNITFDNLSPLSTYLGKPGNPKMGGISFAEYKRRQNQHRDAEIRALLDVPGFIERARDIYQYRNFVCDSGGSLCEVVNPDDPNDAVLNSLSESTVILYIDGNPQHTKMLVDRFRKYPKPMYYQPKFLDTKWMEFKELKKIRHDDDVVPDEFAVWGFEQLLHHRIPLYKKITANFGYEVRMEDIPTINTEDDFLELLGSKIDKR